MTTRIDDFVEKNLPWNFSVNLLDITSITIAFSIISRETIMPLLINNLTDSKIAIGLVPAIFSVCFYLPQLFAANHAERLKRKLPFVMIVSGILERMPYVIGGFIIFFLAESAPTLALIGIYLVIGTAAFGAGVATPAWLSMIGKVLPVRRRGIFFGISDGLGTLLGVIGAYFVGLILDNVSYPLNFSTLFFVASVFFFLSWVGLALNREPESPIVKKRIPLGRYLRKLPAVLRANHNFRRFLFSYSVARLSLMGASFFIVFGNDSYGLSGADVGALTAVFLGSQALMQLALGWLSDRHGHKFNLMLSAFSAVLAALIASLATGIGGLAIAFVLLGTALAAERISHLNIVLEFALPEDQPTYIGLTNTLLAPVVFLAPIIGGWAAGISYQTLFALMMVCGLIGGLLLLIWVKEPRKISPVSLSN